MAEGSADDTSHAQTEQEPEARPRPSRQLTLLLRDAEDAAAARRSPAMRALGAINDIVKSPLFVFLVGANLIGFWPAVDGWMHPAKLADERNRADLALVMPLLQGLKNDDTVKLDATQQILRELRESGQKAAEDGKSPIFDAAYRSLVPVAAQARPSPSAAASEDTLVTLAQGATAGADRGGASVDTATGIAVANGGNPGPEPHPPPVAAATPPAPPPVAIAPTAVAAAAATASLGQGVLVYLQAASNSDASRQAAGAVLDALVARQVLAPGVQNMPCRTIPNATQVRYFNAEDSAKARDLAAFVGQLVGRTVLVSKPPMQAKPGTLEVWIGRDADPGFHCP